MTRTAPGYDALRYAREGGDQQQRQPQHQCGAVAGVLGDHRQRSQQIGHIVGAGDGGGLQREPCQAGQQGDRAADPPKPDQAAVERVWGDPARGQDPGEEAGRSQQRQSRREVQASNQRHRRGGADHQGFTVKVKCPSVLWVSTEVTCHVHAVNPRRQGLQLDDQDAAVILRRGFPLVHAGSGGVGDLDGAEQRLHRFGVGQVQRRRGTGHLRPHRGGSAVKERVGERRLTDQAGGGGSERISVHGVRTTPTIGLPRLCGNRSSK